MLKLSCVVSCVYGMNLEWYVHGVQMWPDILDKARHGGLNVIQTYVFWNAHEPQQGKVNKSINY